MSSDLGPWAGMSLDEAVALHRQAPYRWWVTGGHALELHLGRSWRAHDDTDLSLLRRDVPQVRTVLAGWDIHVAAAGVLTPWSGGALTVEAHQNNLWCRRNPDEPWCLDLTISDGDDEHWVFRRDPSLRLPWERAVLVSADGVPYLAPHLQLLFKSKGARPKDDVDAREVVPALTEDQWSFLCDALPLDHAWRELR